jgi:hypothetical protein
MESSSKSKKTQTPDNIIDFIDNPNILNKVISKIENKIGKKLGKLDALALTAILASIGIYGAYKFKNRAQKTIEKVINNASLQDEIQNLNTNDKNIYDQLIQEYNANYKIINDKLRVENRTYEDLETSIFKKIANKFKIGINIGFKAELSNNITNFFIAEDNLMTFLCMHDLSKNLNKIQQQRNELINKLIQLQEESGDTNIFKQPGKKDCKNKKYSFGTKLIKKNKKYYSLKHQKSIRKR